MVAPFLIGGGLTLGRLLLGTLIHPVRTLTLAAGGDYLITGGEGTKKVAGMAGNKLSSMAEDFARENLGVDPGKIEEWKEQASALAEQVQGYAESKGLNFDMGYLLGIGGGYVAGEMLFGSGVIGALIGGLGYHFLWKEKTKHDFAKSADPETDEPQKALKLESPVVPEPLTEPEPAT